MKKVKVLIVLLLFMSIQLFSQKYSFISKELHEMTEQEMIEYQVQFSLDIPMYDKDGGKIDPNQINSIMESGNFLPVIFANNEHEPKAIVFRNTTKEEKEQIQQMMAYREPYANFKSGIKVPNVVAKDINGNEINIANLKGKIIVINFWYTTCAPCVAEMPALNEMVKKYKKSNVEFISITHENKENVNEFLSKHKFNFKHIVASESLLNVFEIKVFPTTIIVNKDQTMLIKHAGDASKLLDTVLEGLTKF
jgi:peroxiredoxin